jgi:hypothetical protein
VEFSFSNDSSHLYLSRGGIQLHQPQQLLVPIQWWNSTLAASAATCTYPEVEFNFQQRQQLLVPNQRWNSTLATSAATCTYSGVEFSFSNIKSHLYLSRGGINQFQQRQQLLVPIQRWNSSTLATLAATCTYPEVELSTSETPVATCIYPEVEFNFSSGSSHLYLSRGGIQLQQRQQRPNTATSAM